MEGEGVERDGRTGGLGSPLPVGPYCDDPDCAGAGVHAELEFTELLKPSVLLYKSVTFGAGILGIWLGSSGRGIV